MKTNSSELFDLIQSLNKQEKKRVKKDLLLNKKNRNLFALYTIIDKQKKFNDGAVQKKLGYPKLYPQLKQYLLEKIINQVFGGYYDKQTPAYVLKLIAVADLFYKKGLIKHAQKKLEQAIAVCKKNDWIEYIPIINARLSNIITLKQEQKINYTFYTESFKALNQAYLEKKYSAMFRCLQFSDDTTQANQFINDLRIDEYLQDEKYLTTINQKLHYYNFLLAYFNKIDLNYSQSYLYCKKYLDVLTLQSNQEEENNNPDTPEKKHIRAGNNITGFLNVIAAAVSGNFLGDLDEYFNGFIKLKKKFNIDKDPRLLALYNESFQFIYFIIASVNITRRGLEFPDFNNRLNQFYLVRKKMSHRRFTVCDALIAVCFFMKRNWKKCVLNITTILNDNVVYKIDPETYSSILLLQLFVNYETEDFDSLDYNLKKTERYFENHYSARGYEKMIVLFFNEIVINNYPNKIDVLKKYKDELTHLLLNDKEFSLAYMTTEIFIDFESWLDSKITNKPYLDVVKKKFERIKIK